MSQQQPPRDPFVPPPPPSTGNSLFSEGTLAAKRASAKSDARTALILSIIGLFCFGFIFGIFAFRRANEALETIKIYEVAPEARSVAQIAKVLAIIDIVGWVIALIARLMLLSQEA